MASENHTSIGMCDLCGKEADARYEVSKPQHNCCADLLLMLSDCGWPIKVVKHCYLAWPFAGLPRSLLHGQLPQRGWRHIPRRLPQEGQPATVLLPLLTAHSGVWWPCDFVVLISLQPACG